MVGSEQVQRIRPTRFSLGHICTVCVVTISEVWRVTLALHLDIIEKDFILFRADYILVVPNSSY
jgi:hypothetical protein